MLLIKCDSCHHEWQAVTDDPNSMVCDWCGDNGHVLSEYDWIDWTLWTEEVDEWVHR